MSELCLESAVSTRQLQNTAGASLSLRGRGSRGFLMSNSLDAQFRAAPLLLYPRPVQVYSVLLARDVSVSIKKLVHTAAQQL